MVQELKKYSEAAILERFHDLISTPEVKTRLWDEAYFVETVG
jgi:REP element-mobilizing transposase RayT